jgi:hypothetical protein
MSFLPWPELLHYVVIPLAVMLVMSAYFVHLLCKGSMGLGPVVDGEFVQQLEAASEMDEWARKAGFALAGYFKTGKVANTTSFLAIWQQQNASTFFAITYVVATTGPSTISDWCIEFTTSFNRDGALDTSTTRASHFFPPRPGVYRQSFSNLDAAQLWTRHQEGLRYLAAASSIQMSPPTERVEALVEQSVARQAAYIRSLPLWFLRGPYWYLVRRYRFHGISIEEQHRRGMIRLPHEFD